MSEQKPKYLSFWEAVEMIAPPPPDTKLYTRIVELDGEPDQFHKISGLSVETQDQLHSGGLQLAHDMIVHAISNGKVRTYGKKSKAEDAPYQLINPEYFIEASHEVGEDGGELFYDGEQEYADVHIHAGDLHQILGWWIDADESVEDTDKAQEKVIANSKTERGCEKWLAELAQQPGISKKHSIWTLAQTKFGVSLSYRGFCRVWDSSAPVEWKAAGRRRGKL